MALGVFSDNSASAFGGSRGRSMVFVLRAGSHHGDLDGGLPLFRDLQHEWVAHPFALSWCHHGAGDCLGRVVAASK